MGILYDRQITEYGEYESGHHKNGGTFMTSFISSKERIRCKMSEMGTANANVMSFGLRLPLCN